MYLCGCSLLSGSGRCGGAVFGLQSVVQKNKSVSKNSKLFGNSSMQRLNKMSYIFDIYTSFLCYLLLCHFFELKSYLRLCLYAGLYAFSCASVNLFRFCLCGIIYTALLSEVVGETR